MDCTRVGNLICSIRKEKNLTQKQLADLMNISDKTISKWERGLGCPDVSLLNELSEILNVNIEKILSGDLDENPENGGNMKKIKFYVCPQCGNIITSTNDAEISCCSRKLTYMKAQPMDQKHTIKVKEIEYDLYVTFDHEMEKNHFINFIAYVESDRMTFIKLYPEQGNEVRFPVHNRDGIFYFGCSNHGLFYYKTK